MTTAVGDVRVLVVLTPEPVSIYILDRGYTDFERLYRDRWGVELFFRWIKQHIRTQSLFGTSKNAVYTQIWTCITVYVLVAIVRKRLEVEREPDSLLQILSVHAPWNALLAQVLTGPGYTSKYGDIRNQLQLFTL